MRSKQRKLRIGEYGKNLNLTRINQLEDIDIGIKSSKAGWKIFYSAEAEVEHLHEESYKTIQNDRREVGHEIFG